MSDQLEVSEPGGRSMPLGRVGSSVVELVQTTTIADRIAAAVALFGTAGYIPALAGPLETPRLAAMLLALPLGAWVLAGLLRRHDIPAIAGTTFLAACGLSAIINPEPLRSLKGPFSSNLSVLILVAAIGVWALGRATTAQGRRLLTVGAFIGISLNIVIAVAQLVIPVDSGPLGAPPGRSAGLMGNAAFYGCAVVGLAAFAAVRAAQTPTVGRLVLAVWTSFGTGLSGSRGVAAVLILIAIGAVIVTRARAWKAGLAVVVGLAAAEVLTTGFAASSATERISTGSSGGRLTIWRYGLSAVSDRPLLGWGLGNHGFAVRPHFSEDFTRNFAWDDRLMSWQDPHNIVVHLLVSVGVVGTVAAAWFVAAHLKSRTNLAFIAAFGATTAGWLLQPTTAHAVAAPFLFLGCSLPSLAVPLVGARAQARCLMVGAVACAAILVPNALIMHALRSNEPERAERLLVLTPGDTVFADAVAGEFADGAQEGLIDVSTAVAKSSLAVDEDPLRPILWVAHARRLMELEEFDLVPDALNRALELETWNPSAWEAKLAYAIAIGDYEQADETREVICRLDLVMCATGSRFPVDLDELDGD